ncbi:MAG: gliding motility-associated ABC transporter ATP-binding subunit GldA [Cyclobacteriaceae bacterium]|jgi:ABC-2 type transport system ATP-binding protein|nr:gliding motility-associated ABC transporter ATP-binding subunit GldA [Cyclobacteriaceae bacterium]
MTLVVKNLTKVYGPQKAVDDVSFSVGHGEIVGFLGPNGAGKSTTMKIATTYLPPTKGEVWVDGHEVTRQPMAVKRIIGYLPEHNPLYQDMYVREYLRFIGGLYGLQGSTLRQRVSDMIGQCGLEREQHKKIEALSKGYRQRVGLAQAFIHNPQVLILDEPTSGLDPNQLVEIRQLIKTISKDKTVIFSTHILQEVQALCDRVVVINKGKIVADNPLDEFVRTGNGGHVIVIEFNQPVAVIELTQVEGVQRVEELSNFSFRITATSDVRPALFAFAAAKGISLIGLRQEESSLEEVFRVLTTNPKEA